MFISVILSLYINTVLTHMVQEMQDLQMTGDREHNQDRF